MNIDVANDRWPNPWHDQIVYVPVERLAEILRPDDPMQLVHDWYMLGNYLDAYVFRVASSTTFLSVGVRYGSEPESYLSPYARNQKAAIALSKEFDNTKK